MGPHGVICVAELLAGTALMRYHCTEQRTRFVRRRPSAAGMPFISAQPQAPVAIDLQRGVEDVDIVLASALILSLLLLISLVLVG